MSNTTNKNYAIHPAIGVARLGNAELDVYDQSTYFIGPESPFEVANVGQPYKKGGKIRKQAQRFRIFEFVDGEATREITLQEPDVESITWQVHLANRKAALDTTAKEPPSAPTFPPPDFEPALTRNVHVTSNRENLCIDTAPCSVGPGDELKEMSGEIAFPIAGGAPTSKTVVLGSIYCEERSGRLLVFAGSGLSEGLLENGEFSSTAPHNHNPGNQARFANSDNWYDDVSDGSVQAVITFKGGQSITLDQSEQAAWVFCGVPKYAPALNYFTNLQHVALNAAYQPGQDIPNPSFARDIYPILRSVSLLQWVSAKGSLGHGRQRPGYYLAQDRMRLLSDNNPTKNSDPYKARQGVFSRVRNPATIPPRPNNNLTDAEIEPRQMPQLPGQIIQTPGGRDWNLSAVTALQYAMLKKWRDGDFDPDGVYNYKPLDDMDVSNQPPALDCAALEGTCGTPFYPGIESWNIMAVPELYAAPMRIKSDVKPGDLTIGNALPWQADYLDCNDTWWPVQRPDQVTRDGQLLQSWAPEEWDAGTENPKYNEMVRNWWRLGFIVSSDNGATYEETERDLEVPTG